MLQKLATRARNEIVRKLRKRYGLPPRKPREDEQDPLVQCCIQDLPPVPNRVPLGLYYQDIKVPSFASILQSDVPYKICRQLETAYREALAIYDVDNRAIALVLKAGKDLYCYFSASNLVVSDILNFWYPMLIFQELDHNRRVLISFENFLNLYGPPAPHKS
jgi:hypothetical protein